MVCPNCKVDVGGHVGVPCFYCGTILGVDELTPVEETEEDFSRMVAEAKSALSQHEQNKASLSRYHAAILLEYIGKLGAGEWMPVADYSLVADDIDSNIFIGIKRGGRRFMVGLPQADEEIVLDLPDGYAICCKREQPKEGGEGGVIEQ